MRTYVELLKYPLPLPRDSRSSLPHCFQASILLGRHAFAPQVAAVQGGFEGLAAALRADDVPGAAGSSTSSSSRPPGAALLVEDPAPASVLSSYSNFGSDHISENLFAKSLLHKSFGN